MSLFEELVESGKNDEKIIKSFKGKNILCPSIFESDNGNFTMNSEIREKLLEISNSFVETMGVDFFIHDIILTGSLSNYNWSKFSDVDLHIVIDFEELSTNYSIPPNVMYIIKEFFNLKKTSWNEKRKVKIKGFDVEIYVQDISEPHISSGVYSILNDKWIITPNKKYPHIDERKIIEKGEEYTKIIDSFLDNSIDPEKTYEDLSSLFEKIKKFRQCGLNRGGEFSYENLTFKLLRRNGYLKKIIKMKNQLIDKKLSINKTKKKQ
jgi:hypothetical protein